MSNLLTLSYWFTLRPELLGALGFKLILIAIGLMVVLGLIAGLIKRRWAKSLYANFWNSWYYFFLTNAFLGLVLLFFSYEMVPFLSARFWFALWFLGGLVWVYFIVKAALRIPKRQAQMAKEKEFRKYLP